MKAFIAMGGNKFLSFLTHDKPYRGQRSDFKRWIEKDVGIRIDDIKINYALVNED